MTVTPLLVTVQGEPSITTEYFQIVYTVIQGTSLSMSQWFSAFVGYLTCFKLKSLLFR